MVLFKKYILLFAVFFFSCTNPFSVRDAEQPDVQNYSDTYERPTLSETVLINLRYALTEQNITNYQKCFVDANNSSNFVFKFLHDQRIEASLLNDWSLSDEIQYFSNIINSDSLESINLSYSGLQPYQQISTHPDSVLTGFNYDLLLIFNSSSFLYKGQSTIKLVKDNNSLWAIYYWEDRPTTDNYENSWSKLKLKFR